jgi:hypothetical protein
MQSPKLDQTAGRPLAPTTHRRSRGMVLFVAGTLALVLGSIGTVAALAGRSSSASQTQEPSVTLIRPRTVTAPNSTGASAGLSARSTVARPALANGAHLTYIRGVNTHGGTITFDLIQVFENEAAAAAAIEDGKSGDDVEGLYIYIRNQNSRLRTLPVASDLSIQFADGCESPPGRKAALTELAKQTTPFNDLYYYDVTVKDGAIHRITQKLARPAC